MDEPIELLDAINFRMSEHGPTKSTRRTCTNISMNSSVSLRGDLPITRMSSMLWLDAGEPRTTQHPIRSVNHATTNVPWHSCCRPRCFRADWPGLHDRGASGNVIDLSSD